MTGDFTVEAWLPGSLRTEPGEFRSFEARRGASTTVLHTQESVEGVLFLVTSVYDTGDMALRERHMVRADLVSG